MIYISKNNGTEIFTDNLVDWVPDVLRIYLDEHEIGEFENLSTEPTWLRFHLPALDLPERDYVLRILTRGAEIKRESAKVMNWLRPDPQSHQTPNKIVMYE